MYRSVGEAVGRTPKQDAPPYDPSLWEGKDCAFITVLKEAHERQQRQERHRDAQHGGVDEAGLAAPYTSHIQLTYTPTSWWERLMLKLFPRYYALRVMANSDISRLSNEELVMRMHLALQAGDGDFSALIAQELARRRVYLYREEVTTVNTTPGGAAVRRNNYRGMGSPDEGVGIMRARYSDSAVKQGTVSHVADSSFTVPEFLLRRPSYGG
ncbi:hypothetical protein, conserved [Trypanosoma brucei gambiense DAL972]|uniref:Uncharacterized protein n=1 Tax=Trypanosoma brucei gambiense (strain MHOM/CI/86/DAL972) TaxID=679716 RepID=D0A8C4_TRYB9|nr:hypothetical protein, conserved [Trypanosoma brucei gambiense DAL972]CBH17925.1 hypothetical protein, conserved [Trypanosoma brucei gambiense DAL972]|eukprot:XP_011780189.1 hypothetical protein, conserved [Trypanosoma brucei gambiense DAL972]